jgi:hypothetical protein
MQIKRSILTTTIVLVLALLLWFPLGFFLAVSFGSAVGGFAIIGSLILVQWPLMTLMRRHGRLPAASPCEEDL